MQSVPPPSVELLPRVDNLGKVVASIIGTSLPPEVTALIKKRVIQERRRILDRFLNGTTMATLRAFEDYLGIDLSEERPIFEYNVRSRIATEVMEFLKSIQLHGAVAGRFPFEGCSWDLPDATQNEILFEAIIKVFSLKGVCVEMNRKANPPLELVGFIVCPSQPKSQPGPQPDPQPTGHQTA